MSFYNKLRNAFDDDRVESGRSHPGAAIQEYADRFPELVVEWLQHFFFTVINY